MHKGRFYIGVMRTDGTGERLLTENYYQEAPHGRQMEGCWFFIEKQKQVKKERDFLQNYGQ